MTKQFRLQRVRSSLDACEAREMTENAGRINLRGQKIGVKCGVEIGPGVEGNVSS